MPGDHSDRFPVDVAIYGSCVSRDMCEFWPEAQVKAYVARQSAIVRFGPVGASRFPTDALTSKFQARMYSDDKRGNAGNTIIRAGAGLLILDIVDERRGVWRFPDGKFLTNSVEAFRAGVDVWAPRMGARLIEFGTDEHFYLWRTAIEHLLGHARAHRKKSPFVSVFIDVDWAEATEGQPLPRGIKHAMGAANRQVVRQFDRFTKSLQLGKPLGVVAEEIFDRIPSPVEELAKEARRMNVLSRRYADVLAARSDFVVRRTVDELRMDPDHKWGLNAYHYSADNYRSIVESMREIVARGPSADGATPRT